MAAYLCSVRGLQFIADLRRDPDLLGFIRDAFLKESGEALIRKHAGVDPLFTSEGYRAYALDLLERMTNPYLQDSVERVGRDPHRKLGWDDRLMGTLRLALHQNIVPRRYAVGTAAALATLDPSFLQAGKPARELLAPLWGHEIGLCAWLCTKTLSPAATPWGQQPPWPPSTLHFCKRESPRASCSLRSGAMRSDFAPGFAPKHCPPPLRRGDSSRLGHPRPFISASGKARARAARSALGP